MTIPCAVCATPMDRWTDVTYSMDRRQFCSLGCIWKYRGKKRLA